MNSNSNTFFKHMSNQDYSSHMVVYAKMVSELRSLQKMNKKHYKHVKVKISFAFEQALMKNIPVPFTLLCVL